MSQLPLDVTPRSLVQAFVSCRLDYCNALFVGVADVHLRLSVASSRQVVNLVPGARRHDHITPVLYIGFQFVRE